MTLLVDPAALGGLAGLIAVASWAMGRAHGPLAKERLPERGVPDHGQAGPPDAPLAESDLAESDGAGPPLAPPHTAPAPCQQRALEERRAALARPFTLAELHAEASAIRRDERILWDEPCDDGLTVLAGAAPGAGCRFIGLSGQPTCPVATRRACPDSGACQSAGAQPSSLSPALSSLTRV